jgi:trehalose 6-phosphate synthase
MAADRRRLIVVSNRGPVGFARDATGELVTSRGAGGLVTALRGLLAHHDVTWIASALSQEDRAVAAEGVREEVTRDGSPFRLRLVAHDERAYDLYYNVVANPALWFVQHLLWDYKLDPDEDLVGAWHEGYVPVNEAFAAAVVEELDAMPDAAVFFQDYHLYVAPGLVRKRRPNASLGHFVHIPWQAADAWSVLPAEIARAVHEGLLANDVVGFHTERWAGNFRSACAELVGGTEGTLVHANPISVDVQEFESLARSPAVLEAERELSSRRPERMILRVDRTDPSKNVVRGIQAYGRLLELRPDLHGRVGMLARLDPSRQEIPEYIAYVDAIEAAVAEVNERFGRAGWLPVRLEVADDFPMSLAAYKQFDVLLVNALYDGLNLVAKESALVNAVDGALVLSRNAGAFEELGEWTVPVDPLDVEQQARALEEALELPVEERRRRLEGIRERVRRHDIRAWLEAEQAALERASTMHA